MEKRTYTHVQALLPGIKSMLAEGKTQRDAAESYGFPGKQAVKQSCLRVSGEKNENWKLGSFCGLRDSREERLRQETL